ncbi:MAG: hypothetical protein ACLTYN_08280 [Dysosmobacter welbionis]
MMLPGPQKRTGPADRGGLRRFRPASGASSEPGHPVFRLSPLGLAAPWCFPWLLDRLAAGNHRWRLIHRAFVWLPYGGTGCAAGAGGLIINRGRSDMTPRRQTRVIVLGVNELSRPVPAGPG